MASSASSANISLLIFAASGFVGLLLFFILTIVYAYQKKILRHKQLEKDLEIEMQHKMLQALVEGQEKERERLGRDIHDSIGAQLSTIKLYLAELKTHTLNPSTEKLLQEGIDLLTTSIQDLRAISQDLIPQPLQRLGLVETLRMYCNKLSLANGTNINFSTNTSVVGIEDVASLMIFRIIQEVINNAIKHGKSKTISISLVDQVHELLISIEEDGTPYSWEEIKQRARSDGSGIINIETRVSLLNGAFYQNNEEDKNIISIKIPINGE